MTPERARTLAEMWTLIDAAKQRAVLDEAVVSPSDLASVSLAIDAIYGPKAGPKYLRDCLRRAVIHVLPAPSASETRDADEIPVLPAPVAPVADDGLDQGQTGADSGEVVEDGLRV